MPTSSNNLIFLAPYISLSICLIDIYAARQYNNYYKNFVVLRIDDVISIRLDLGIGQGRAIAWGCDLSDQYVRINADYTT